MDHQHTASHKLEDQAATAALYVTNAEKKKKAKHAEDQDTRLSSAGAATSLKYANPRDLPSFPSAGLANKESSAGAAASLAHGNQKSFEHWKPDPSSSANRAAALASDYKAAPLWQPELSATGSKAALQASRDGGNVEIWRPEATSEGNSAAGKALRNKTISPTLDRGYTPDGSRRALIAATGAMSGRKRSGSVPTLNSSYPDSHNSAANALSAATIANRSSGKSVRRNDGLGSPAINAARIHNAAISNLSREMYTSHPPVAPEVEEKKRQDGLRAAAMSMAKQMYDLQQKSIEQAAGGGRSDSHYAANSVSRRPASVASSEDSYPPAPQYANLQEAAQKLAAERLAKLHDEHAAYRTYYGTNAAKPGRLSSIRGRVRRRASSDGDVRDSDEERSQQIRSEMSTFNNQVAQVDAKKRQKDRESLLAAAQRNVTANMHGMDERVFNETGKVSPAMMAEWEAKASERAKAESDARMVNHGRVHIGGGKFLDQSEVDAIAAARVQPTLDEISEKAEAQRARDEERRLEEEENRRIAEEKVKDEKERNLNTKTEWKRFKEEEKQKEKARKEEERAKKAEEKQLRKEEKQKSQTIPLAALTGIEVNPEKSPTSPEAPVQGFTPAAETTSRDKTAAPEMKSPGDVGIASESATVPPAAASEVVSPVSISQAESPTAEATVPTIEPLSTRIAPTTETTVSGATPSSKSEPKSDSKVSSWLKTKFARRSSKAPKPTDSYSADPVPSNGNKAFIGGAALAATDPAATTTEGSNPITEQREDSVREVAMAGRPEAASAPPPTVAGKPISAPIATVDLEELYAPPSNEPKTPNPLNSNPTHPLPTAPSVLPHSASISSLSDSEPENERGRPPPPGVVRKRAAAAAVGAVGDTAGAAGDGEAMGDEVEAGAGGKQTTAVSDLKNSEKFAAGGDEGGDGEGDDETFEEAKDTFDSGPLPLPRFAKPRQGESPVRDSRFSEDL